MLITAFSILIIALPSFLAGAFLLRATGPNIYSIDSMAGASQLVATLVCFVSGTLICISFGLFLSYFFVVEILTLSNPLFVPTMMLIGLLLYRLRVSQPVIYGILECCFAVIAISFATFVTGQDALAKIIGMAAGAYIFVRGLDNIDRGLPDPWRVKLKLIFSQRRA
jgi:hypothetical protein